MIRLFQHRHRFQDRGQNRYGGITYKVCLKCRKSYIRVNSIGEPEKWEECDPIPELDNQFDENDKFIFRK